MSSRSGAGPPAARRRELLTAAWADPLDFTIEARIVFLDPLGRGVVLGADSAGANYAVPAFRGIELLTVGVDLLKVILGRLQVIPVGWR
jgi:hypothetical protein